MHWSQIVHPNLLESGWQEPIIINSPLLSPVYFFWVTVMKWYTLMDLYQLSVKRIHLNVKENEFKIFYSTKLKYENEWAWNLCSLPRKHKFLNIKIMFNSRTHIWLSYKNYFKILNIIKIKYEFIYSKII